MNSVSNNLRHIHQRIQSACQKAGRAEASVQLLCVSKLHPAAEILEAYQAGERHFGENYAQELRDKSQQLIALKDLLFHFIGPLQTNKAKYVAKHAYAFHALDRKEVAEELSRRREGSPLRCFLEVNVGNEDSKSGVRLEEAVRLKKEVEGLPGIIVTGLMCLPPLAENPEDTRLHFRSVAQLAKEMGLSELSMGTTSDFEVAIEEGATLVRVGTAIFGKRQA